MFTRSISCETQFCYRTINPCLAGPRCCCLGPRSPRAQLRAPSCHHHAAAHWPPVVVAGPPLVRAPATFWPRPWRMVQWGVKTLHNLNMHINSVRVSEYHWINEAASCVKYWWVTQVTLLHTCSARHASLCLTLPVLMWTVVLDLNDSIKESVRPTHEYSSYCTHALLGYFIQFQSADIFCRKKAQKEIMWPSLAQHWCCCVAVVVGIIKLIKWLQNIIKLHILCCVPNPAQCCEPFSSLRPAVVCGSTGARHQTLSITHFSLYKLCCLPSPSLIQYFDS